MSPRKKTTGNGEAPESLQAARCAPVSVFLHPMHAATMRSMRSYAATILFAALGALVWALWPPSLSTASENENSRAGKLDLSARPRFGVASFYANEFFGKRMADGARMNPDSNNAASRTLPLGTVARVTGVASGKSAIVKIEDRGPYVRGRIVDLSPSTARKIGITQRMGVAEVIVAPIAVPLPGGGVKLGSIANAHDTRLATAMEEMHPIS